MVAEEFEERVGTYRLIAYTEQEPVAKVLTGGFGGRRRVCSACSYSPASSALI